MATGMNSSILNWPVDISLERKTFKTVKGVSMLKRCICMITTQYVCRNSGAARGQSISSNGISIFIQEYLVFTSGAPFINMVLL